MSAANHECVFVEEREPSGRLILGPCLTCGTSALDALEQLRSVEVRVRALCEDAEQWGTDVRANRLCAALDGPQPL